MSPSPLSRLVRLLLILHSLLNIAQGLYTLISPQGYAAMAGTMFAGAPDKALQSIGLGAVGVGWYQLVFAYQGNRALVLATIPLRLLFAATMASWGTGYLGVVGYELAVALICGVAAFA